MDRWRDSQPRATKDVDLVISLDLISDSTNHLAILAALEKNQFMLTKSTFGKRWQFEKKIDQDRNVILELHAPKPNEQQRNVQVDGMRVKHKPSLGAAGIHGRTNPEAVGCEQHPSRLELEGQTFLVVNPITWTVMKLTAMRDRWAFSQDQSKSQAFRDFSQAQATKHALDTCRVIALVTEHERDSANEILSAIKDETPVRTASEILRSIFQDETNPLMASARNSWLAGDYEQIHRILDGWFL